MTFNSIISRLYDYGVRSYYRDEQADIVIYCADCREVLPQLADSSVDLLCTDPPLLIN